MGKLDGERIEKLIFSSQFLFSPIPYPFLSPMENLRNKIHRLIEQLSEDELEKTFQTVHNLRCDFQMVKAIQEVKDFQQPWDFLNDEEAMKYLEEQ